MNVKGTIRVPFELNSGDYDKIRKKFETMLGRELTFDVEVEPDLIGGFVVYLDGKVYDMSVKTRLCEMRQHLVEGLQS